MNVSLHHLSYSVRLFLLEWRARQVETYRVGDGGDILIVCAITESDGDWYVVEVVGVVPSIREAEASVRTNSIGEYGFDT